MLEVIFINGTQKHFYSPFILHITSTTLMIYLTKLFMIFTPFICRIGIFITHSTRFAFDRKVEKLSTEMAKVAPNNEPSNAHIAFAMFHHS